LGFGNILHEQGQSGGQFRVPDEGAFFDALADNGSARQVMGDEKLKMLLTMGKYHVD
jgi:hypothetical protein